MGTSENRRLMYVHELNFPDRTALSDVLDRDDKWEELGGTYMQYDINTLERIKSYKLCQLSPTKELLKLWGEQNHTVLELFIHLSSMKHYEAMTKIEHLVDDQYHMLIVRGEENLCRVMGDLESKPGPSGNTQQLVNGNISVSNIKKDMKIGSHNLNKPSKEASISKKVILPPVESDIENDSPSKIQDTLKPKENKVNQSAPSDNKENRGPVETPRDQSDGTQRKLSNASSISSNVEPCTPLILYRELEAATNKWDKSLILGRGGFGIVYKGQWMNSPVAIKKLETQDGASEEFLRAQQQQSIREINYLNQFRHDNILFLFGYSDDGDIPCLVYQFMENGSLEDRLLCRQGTEPLYWPSRCNIATGVARGLQFLHKRNNPFSLKPLIHGDIKSANILLDTSFVPKIGDFGLAKEGPPQQYTHVTVSKVHGTRPYLPSDFLRHKKFSTKVDTYSFGVVLFEIATGLRAYEESRPKRFLGDYVKTFDIARLDELADTKAGIDNAGIARGLMSIGKRCAMDLARDRPEMDTVLEQLNHLTELLKQSLKANYLIRQDSLSPTTPRAIQQYYDHMSHQRRSSIPNSTAMVVGTGGSVGIRQFTPRAIPPQMVQPSFIGHSPLISVTPPSAGNQQKTNESQKRGTEEDEEIRRRQLASSASPFVTSPVDELPLLSELGISTPN